VAGAVVIVKLLKSGSNPPQPPIDPTNKGGIEPKPTLSAKEAFLDNVDKFSAILPQLNDSLNVELWSEQIVDINNPQLTALWKRCLNDTYRWKQLLSSWGLRQDTCKSFTYLNKYSNMYETSDNATPEEGCKYRVIDGCWILTNDNSGDKRIVKKGIIEKL